MKKSSADRAKLRSLPWKRHSPLALIALSILFALPVPRSAAQLTTADITGTVTDNGGAVVPNATVTLLNLGTKESRTQQSNGDGSYTFSLLPPGHYSITVGASGFKTFSIPDLDAEAGDRARADAHLTIGEASQTIQVTAATPLLQADNPTVNTNVDERQVQDLPLNGRNFVQLVQLVPGANEGPGNGLTSGGRPDDRRPTNGFSVNGFDDVLNNEIIDGLDNNERIIGTIGVKPSVEAIQEITVETNNYLPEVGRTAGGVVNVVTKAGTNNFHGSAYEFFRNDILDARSYFSRVGTTPKPELRQNQFGGSLGGPILKNKAFFFGDYEGFRLVSGGTTFTSTVPTAAQYDAIHSLNGLTPQDILNAGNVNKGAAVPYAVDPVALNYLQLFPLPNSGGPTAVSNNYVSNPSRTQYSTTTDGRYDQNIGSRDTFYARFTYNNVGTNTPAQLPTAPNGVVAGGGRYNFSGTAENLAYGYQLNFTHIFSPTLVLELKAGYTRINNASFPLNYGKNVDTAFGFPDTMNFNATASGLTPIGINNFEDLGDGAYVPLVDVDNTFQYVGNVSYTRGQHSMRFGANLIRRQARNIQSPSALGSFSFGLSTDTVAGNSAQTNANVLASMLAGADTGPGRVYDLFPPDYRTWEPGFYAQDNWKITPTLTITYGARYDIFTPFTEAHNRISNFNYYQALADGGVNVGDALQVAGVNGVSSTAGVRTDYSNFAPRVGFAYTAGPGIVVRGGYGLSFFPGNYTSNADLKNAPFTSSFSPTCESAAAYNIQIANGASASSISPTCGSIGLAAQDVFDNGLPVPVGQTINSNPISFEAEDPHLRQGLVQQFNLQVEKGFGANVVTVGYVGNLGRHLPETINDINEPDLATVAANPAAPRQIVGPTATATNPGGNINGIGWYMSEGVSNYNAFQASVLRRFSKGLSLNVNYTFAHALSDIAGLSEEGQEGWGNADPHNIARYEYGNADNDIRNRFVAESNYQIPFGNNFSGMKKFALGGWQVNEIFAWQTGKPFTVVNSSADGGFGNRARTLYNGGVDRPNLSGPLYPAHQSMSEWFNTAAFAPQTLGTVGTEARNQLFGPHFRHLDVSLFKDFAISEAVRVQFRSEFFNVTNTPSFYINNNVNSSPSTLLGNASFGQITATDPNYSPRQIQFALKVLF